MKITAQMEKQLAERLLLLPQGTQLSEKEILERLNDCELNGQKIPKEQIDGVVQKLIGVYDIANRVATSGTILTNNGGYRVPSIEPLIMGFKREIKLSSVYESRHRQSLVYVFGVDASTVPLQGKGTNETTRFLLSGSPKPVQEIYDHFENGIAQGALGNELYIPTSKDTEELNLHMTETAKDFSSSMISYFTMAGQKNPDSIAYAILVRDEDRLVRFWKSINHPNFKAITQARKKGDASKLITSLVEEERTAMITSVTLANRSMSTFNSYFRNNARFVYESNKDTVQVTPEGINGISINAASVIDKFNKPNDTKHVYGVSGVESGSIQAGDIGRVNAMGFLRKK